MTATPASRGHTRPPPQTRDDGHAGESRPHPSAPHHRKRTGEAEHRQGTLHDRKRHAVRQPLRQHRPEGPDREASWEGDGADPRRLTARHGHDDRPEPQQSDTGQQHRADEEPRHVQGWHGGPGEQHDDEDHLADNHQHTTREHRSTWRQASHSPGESSKRCLDHPSSLQSVPGPPASRTHRPDAGNRTTRRPPRSPRCPAPSSADRRAGSTPLFVLGAATLLAAALPDGAVYEPFSYYWLVAGPLVFAVAAGLFYRRTKREGVGTPAAVYRRTAIIIGIVFVLAFPLGALWGGTMVMVGLGLLVLGLLQGSVAVAVAAVLFGTVGVLQSLSLVSNTIWHVTGVPASNRAVIAGLGLVILLAATGLRLRESTTA
jgi:hypothetical protein